MGISHSDGRDRRLWHSNQIYSEMKNGNLRDRQARHWPTTWRFFDPHTRPVFCCTVQVSRWYNCWFIFFWRIQSIPNFLLNRLSNGTRVSLGTTTMWHERYRLLDCLRPLWPDWPNLLFFHGRLLAFSFSSKQIMPIFLISILPPLPKVDPC